MKAIVLDTKTGQTAESDGLCSLEWAEGDWACDCNRALLFGDSELDGVCSGSRRYLVVRAEMTDTDCAYTLAELNAEYPVELLAKHGIAP